MFDPKKKGNDLRNKIVVLVAEDVFFRLHFQQKINWIECNIFQEIYTLIFNETILFKNRYFRSRLL